MTYLKNVASLRLDTGLCTGCGMCVSVCPHEVFAVHSRKAQVIDKDRCMECGACMINCPEGAITVSKGVGCAYSVIVSKLKGADDISCGCSGDADNGDQDCGCC